MGRRLFNPAYFNDIGLDNIVPISLGGTSATSADVAALTLNFVSRSMVGVANGVASLDANGLVPMTQLPDAVYDVIEVSAYSALPSPGAAGKIYVTQDTGLLYRWQDDAYVQLNTSVAASSVAERLSSARKINGTNFDGTSDITTQSWGTARTITIGTTDKTIDGSADVSWSLAEIGAAPTSHTHTTANIADFVIDTPASGQFLRYNGTNWINATLSASDIPSLDASKITTGVISPALLTGTYTISISGNAATATKLASAVTINGVSFDGSANITINAVDATPRIAVSEKGAPNGVATLDENGLVPSTQLPSYVDDVLEYDSAPLFPAVGERGKIYVALDTNQVYRWSGSAYININNSVGSADTATRLATPRKINGTNFDGTSDITTANWGTGRTITIGSTGKTVDGSANITWSLAEIGAASADHSHALANITDFTITSPSAGQFFRYNGTKWVNTTLSSSDIPELDASKITTGNIADARLSNTFIEKMTVLNFFASI